DRAPCRGRHIRGRDDHVHLPPPARGPAPGRAVPDGRAEHPACAPGHGDATGVRGLLRHAPVPLLPWGPLPRVRHERRGHARSARPDGVRHTDEHRGRRRGPARPRGGRPRRPGRPGGRGRVLHERRAGDLPGPRAARAGRGRGVDPRCVARPGGTRLPPSGPGPGGGGGLPGLGRGRPDGPEGDDPRALRGARGRRRPVHPRPHHRRPARLRPAGGALRPGCVGAALGAGARAAAPQPL
ncbi:MAG: hypothetical protein AVDCRST_MAG20-654, partial [uncultured Acidimicrobiales bacterium]